TQDQGEARAGAAGGLHLSAKGALAERGRHGQAGLAHGNGELSCLIAGAIARGDQKDVGRRLRETLGVGLLVVEDAALDACADADARGGWSAELLGQSVVAAATADGR